ncbi:hypothetical protein P8452_42792 [Trifolium repens]|nr:hypothetical protein P8452_42792 [Trifolium repens]
MELEKEKGKEEEGWEQQIEIVSWFRQTDVHRRGLHASDLWGLEDEEELVFGDRPSLKRNRVWTWLYLKVLSSGCTKSWRNEGWVNF